MTIGHLEKKRDVKLHQKTTDQELAFQTQMPFPEQNFERKQITYDQNPMTTILSNIQLKLESIEDRLGKVERLN